MPTSSMPPALPRGIAGPDETHRTIAHRRGAEAANDRLGNEVAGIGIVRGETIEDVLIRQQPLQHRLDRVVGRHGRGLQRQARRLGETFRRRIFERHLRRTVGARPDHARGAIDIAGLNAMGKGRAAMAPRIIGHRQRRGRRKHPRSTGQKKRAPCQRLGNNRHATSGQARESTARPFRTGMSVR